MYICFLSKLSYMFRRVIHHPQGEFRVTCSKRSAFYNDIALIVSQSIK